MVIRKKDPKYFMSIEEKLDHQRKQRPEKLPDECEGCERYTFCDESGNRNIYLCTHWYPERRDGGWQ